MAAKVRGTVLGLLLLVVLALTPFRPLKVTGHSMEPTLHNGETYLLDQFYWKRSGLRRSDIVAVKHGQEVWVKRLIGMPGDRLRITRTDEDWITGISNLTMSPEPARDGRQDEIRDVGPDEVFVIGDNLNRSMDSTNQEAGAFKKADIIGVVRAFPFRREFPFQKHL